MTSTMQDNLADEVVNMCGLRFSKVRMARDYSQGGGLVVAAGSHDESINTVGIWDTDVVRDPRQADWLVDHRGFKVDGSVTCLEFARSDGGLLLWSGTSRGSLQLLSGHVGEAEYQDDDEGTTTQHKWSLSEQSYVCDSSDQGVGKPLHEAAVSAVAVHSDSQVALTAGEDGVIRQVQITPAGTVVTSKWGQDVADWVALYDVKYATSSVDNFFTAGAAGGLRMWDVRTPASHKTFGMGTGFVSVEPVETFLLAGGEAGEICIFDTRSERLPLYTHAAQPGAAVADGFHMAEVWTIRACGGEGDVFLSCCADGTVLSSVPELETKISIKPVGWHRYSQAVNDVDAFIINPGLKSESTLIMCAADSGLLLGERSTFGGNMMLE